MSWVKAVQPKIVGHAKVTKADGRVFTVDIPQVDPVTMYQAEDGSIFTEIPPGYELMED